MNRYVLHPKPKRWDARLNPACIRLLRPLRVHKRRRAQRLVAIEVRGTERVRAALDRGAGVLITPNHSGHADAYIMYEAAERIGTPFYFMSAWQVFAMNHPIGRRIMQWHGCFSVDREGADKEALKTAVEILQSRPQPLVIFPEGEVYHQNDRVTPFREGAAAIATLAAKKATRPIMAVPCAIRYRYAEDPTPALVELMSRLERAILWRPRPDLPLPQRVYRFAEGLLALKEIEYLGETRDGPLPARVAALADSILRGVEANHGLPPGGRGGAATILPERVKAARAAILAKLGELEESSRPESEKAAARQALARDLDDVFLVVQSFSYPGDYVDESPTVERLAETLDKFEEDVLGLETATVRADRRAIVAFGEPISVGGGESGRGGERLKAGELTKALEAGVQALLDANR